MILIGTDEMATLYGKATASAFRQHKKRYPEQVPPRAIGWKWDKEEVMQFLRDKPWREKKVVNSVNARNAGRKRNSGAVALRVM